MRSGYLRGLTAFVNALDRPLALFIGLERDTVRASVARLSLGERSFAQQDQAMSLVAFGCIVLGGGAAVTGLLLALGASLMSSVVLDMISRVLLGVIAPAGILLVIVRVRSYVGHRRYDLERELPRLEFPGAEPRSWEVLPLAIAYGLGIWLFSRG